LSSDDDDGAACPPEPDTPTNRKVSTTDNARCAGMTSAKALVLGSSKVGALQIIRPPTADRVPSVPPLSARGRKCLLHAAKWSNLGFHADQVITQVEFPPYHRPRNPLDLVASVIVFGRMLEAFRRVS
jgi:hypothetical protein